MGEGGDKQHKPLRAYNIHTITTTYSNSINYKAYASFYPKLLSDKIAETVLLNYFKNVYRYARIYCDDYVRSATETITNMKN